MVPKNYRFGGGADYSLLHPLVALLLVAAVICILLLPRKYAALPFLWMVLLVPAAQEIYVVGMHFFALRLVILAGVVRALASSKPKGMLAGGARGIDRAFLYCTIVQVIAPIILFQEVQTVVYQLGYVWDWLGGYILCRWLLQDEQDIYRMLKFLSLLLIPVAAGMIMEQWRHFNPFSILGGLPSAPAVREGKTRSQGVFAHSLMAGSFAAVLAPLYLLLWKEGRSKSFALLGIVVVSIMVFTSNSSTPLLAYLGGIGAVFLWPMRRRMRLIRIGIVVTLVGLNMVMKAPVWFLIARVDVMGGSSSYHRAELIDQCIRHFSQWWLIGTNQNGTWGLDMFDVQNQYVNVAITGGLLALVFFIITISRAFGAVGNARLRVEGNRHGEWVSWLLGCSMFATIVGFFGVNYFDQGRVVYFILLSMITDFAAVTTRANNLVRMRKVPDAVLELPRISIPHHPVFIGYE